MATAKEILRAHRQQFCLDWMEASKTAARLGSHKPARDALAAIHEIELQPAGAAAVTISTNIVLPGLPQPSRAQAATQPVVLVPAAPPPGTPPNDS